MRVLLDTHTLLWAVDQPSELGIEAVKCLQNPENELLLSAASVWEIAIKVGLKKLTLSLPYREWLEKARGELSVAILPIAVAHADAVIGLAAHHRDPFDRMIAAQASVEKMSLVTIDSVFTRYGVKQIWN